jgi:mono/diheme cytochrome c family protein/uncharacterized membrane protein
MNDDRPFWRTPGVLLSLATLVALVVTDAVLRHLGGKPSDFTLFVGRFHPLVVHLPIGFVLLVAAAEAATLAPRWRPRVDAAIGLALPLVVAATATAFVLGHLLARAGDFAPNAINVHRRFELFASVGICLCPLGWQYQAHAGSERARWMYRGLLAVTLGVLSLGAHFGGGLTHGDTYLTRYAPEPLKRLLGTAPAPRASASAAAGAPAREPRLFADVIQPILGERCVSCHGDEKVKGGLRLDSLANIMKGGEDGPVVAPGNPSSSPLLARTLLPVNDDDHMPPEGKPGLMPPEVAAIRFWIERGASDALLVRDLLVPADARSLLEHALAGSASATTPTAVTAPGAASSSGSVATAGSASAPPASAAKSYETAPPRTAAPPAPRATSPPTSSPAPSLAPSSPATAAAAPKSASAVLSEHCVKCHGPEKQKGKLRADSLTALLQGGKSGPAIVPGDARASTLVKRLNLSLTDDKHMPPAKEPQLTPHEIATVSAWIAGLDTAPRPSSTAPASAPRRTPNGSVPAKGAPAVAPAATATPPSDAGARGNTTSDAGAPSPELLANLPSRLALFPTEVQPLLRARCASCHGGKTPAGGLAIADYAALLRGGDTGPAVTPGKPDQSLLVYRIRLPPDADDHMPPTKAPQLTANEIALISAWVEHGGSSTDETALETLPGPAVAAIAAHPPARSASDVGRASPPPRGPGCGACGVVAHDRAPARSLVLSAFLAAVFCVRRRSRRSLISV